MAIVRLLISKIKPRRGSFNFQILTILLLNNPSLIRTIRYLKQNKAIIVILYGKLILTFQLENI